MTVDLISPLAPRTSLDIGSPFNKRILHSIDQTLPTHAPQNSFRFFTGRAVNVRSHGHKYLLILDGKVTLYKEEVATEEWASVEAQQSYQTRNFRR